MNRDTLRYAAIRILNFAVALFLFLGIGWLSDRILRFSLSVVDYTFDDAAPCIMRLIFRCLLYYSVQRAFMIADAQGQKQYLESENGAKGRARFLVTSPAFWVCLIGTAAVTSLFPRAFGMADLQAVLPLSPLLLRGAVTGAYLLLTPIVCLSAMREWRTLQWELQAPGRFGRRPSNRIDLLPRILHIAVVYPAISLVTPFVLPALLSLYRIFDMAKVQILIAAAVLLLLYIADTYLRAFRIRRAFFTDLRRTVTRKGYTLSKLSHPYLSLFAEQRGANFTVFANGKTYSVKLLCGLRHKNPMYLLPNGEGVTVHRFRLPRAVDDFFQFHTCFSYAFDGDGKKILVVLPTPNRIFAVTPSSRHLLSIGDTVEGYTVMTGSSFLGALEYDRL